MVIRLKIMNELPVHMTVSPASCFVLFQFEPILNSQISHGNLHLGLFLKKLEDLEKPGLHGSYGLEMTSGCLYRPRIYALLRGYFTCWYHLPGTLVTMCSLSPPLGYFGKHTREKGLEGFLYS